MHLLTNTLLRLVRRTAYALVIFAATTPLLPRLTVPDDPSGSACTLCSYELATRVESDYGTRLETSSGNVDAGLFASLLMLSFSSDPVRLGPWSKYFPDPTSYDSTTLPPRYHHMSTSISAIQLGKKICLDMITRLSSTSLAIYTF